jgi:hypothetical protein
MSGVDKRLALVLEITGSDSEADIASSDYDKVEDHFISCAVSVICSDDEINKLREAGFNELADKMKDLEDASEAYDWSRENL